MGFFSRKSAASATPAFTADPADLIRIATQAFGGNSPNPPGLSAISSAELDGYVVAALESAKYPTAGSDEWESLQTRFLDELTAAAEKAGDWGFIGAMCVAWNFVVSAQDHDPRYLAILERALNSLRLDGVAYPAVPPFAIEYGQTVHGWDGARPAGWPSALDDVRVPAPGEGTAVSDLEPGESRRLAQPQAGDHSNVIYAERRSDESIVAVIGGIDASDGGRKRWEWHGLEAPTYPAFLRELGERLVTPSFWAHEELAPYFPCRSKSRDTMREEARSAALSASVSP